MGMSKTCYDEKYSLPGIGKPATHRERQHAAINKRHHLRGCSQAERKGQEQNQNHNPNLNLKAPGITQASSKPWVGADEVELTDETETAWDVTVEVEAEDEAEKCGVG